VVISSDRGGCPSARRLHIRTSLHPAGCGRGGGRGCGEAVGESLPKHPAPNGDPGGQLSGDVHTVGGLPGADFVTALRYARGCGCRTAVAADWETTWKKSQGVRSLRDDPLATAADAALVWSPQRLFAGARRGGGAWMLSPAVTGRASG
jgi:hypothetical protein